MPQGVDYAFGRPSMSALKNAGVKFVCRYLSHSPSKNLTRAEAEKLTDAGIWIVVVWETTAQRALSGHAGGVADAKDAEAQARSCGMPDDRPVYFAVDWDASSGQQAAINAYLDGAASVLGKGRVGIYGGYGPVKRALDGRHATWAWQTYAWSGGRWDGRAQLQQYSNGHTIGGVGCDYDRAEKSDYGQWRVGVTPGGDDMALVCSLGVDGTQVIDAGAHADVVFTKEYTDKHGLHGENGLSVAIAKAAYWVNADALVELRGLTPASKIDIAWTRVKDDGTFLDDAWRLTYTADENGAVRGQIGGQFGVDASNRLRLRVYNAGGAAVTVQSCLAKVSLLQY
jgi:glycoside hydrolase-like protein